MDKKTIKRPRGLWSNRNVTVDCWSCNAFWLYLKRIDWSFKKNTYKRSRKHKRSFSLRLLKDERGNGSIEFLILLPIILFMIFGSVDYYITQMQYNHLENTKNYYTNVMKIQGTLTNTDLVDLNYVLHHTGFKNIHISARDYNNTELDEKIIYRNTEKPNTSRMSLLIKAEPSFEPFAFGKLLGTKDSEIGDGFYFLVKGDTLSERPYGND